MRIAPVLLAIIPLVATLACLVPWRRMRWLVTLVAGVACLALAIALIPSVAHGPVTVGFLRVDAISLVFLVSTALLYALAGMYTIGYVSGHDHTAEADGHGAGADPNSGTNPGAAAEQHTSPADPGTGAAQVRTARHLGSHELRLYVGLNVFAWSMICAPIVNGLALVWIAVEITTVVSALLVALDATSRAAEAAWKYVLLASAGLGIGLLATIVMYYAGATVLGRAYDLAFAPLLDASGTLPHAPVRLAFVLAVVGFGTKVGLFPMHTWLPDAHSEAPTPVSALLSGSLLAVSFYAVLRYFQVAVGTLGPGFPRGVLLVFGVLTLLLGALYLLDQRDIKRLLAYSSIEHMGILAIGVGLGVPLAAAGVLLHVVGHAAAKGNAFFGAGVLVKKFGTKDVARIRSALTALPMSGPLFMFSILALSALPPFALFRSEFQIVAGGMSSPHGILTAVLVVLVTVAFVGLSAATTRMMFVQGSAAPAVGEPSRWMVAPMVLGMAVLLVLGVHPPADLAAIFTQGAAALAGG